ncbi:MAG: glycosyltransferase [Pseudobutyrivibrio sp.]|nr:glycosyltransferase [Pseudobutyrivibrio sp.]
MKKILFYYWDPIDGPAGGGVTAYLKELFPLLLKREEFEIYYLSSGRKYDNTDAIYIREIKNIYSPTIKSYEVVNCPVLGPAKQSIKNIRIYLEDVKVKAVLKKFIDDIGGFDIIHFHSLEGLPLKVLELKDEYPNTRFFYSFHNYYPLCNQVNLWKNDSEKCNITDYRECDNCYARENYDLALYRFKHLEIPGLKQKNIKESIKNPDRDDLAVYKDFFELNKKYFNKYMDKMIAVSQRTKEVLVSHGYLEQKIDVIYVGTDVAERGAAMRSNCSRTSEEPLQLVYVGYPRRDKGFYFFIDSLEAMPKEISQRIKVTIVSRNISEDAVDRLKSAEKKLECLEIHNGFKDYEDLQQILSNQDLGIVPVMWEDNLPRVAIEQIAMGVPILTSNLGGASELFGRNPNYVFEAGNIDDFIKKLGEILDNPDLLDEFWKNVRPLITMEEHAKKLSSLYMEK